MASTLNSDLTINQIYIHSTPYNFVYSQNKGYIKFLNMNELSTSHQNFHNLASTKHRHNRHEVKYKKLGIKFECQP